jgi:hypothetical protein
MNEDDIGRMLGRIAAAVDHRLMAIGARTAAWEATDWPIMRLFQVCASDREVAAVGTRRYDEEGNEHEGAGGFTGTQRVQTLALRMQAIRAARGLTKSHISSAPENPHVLPSPRIRSDAAPTSLHPTVSCSQKLVSR